MSKAVLNIKVDPEIKQDVQAFAAELGIPVSVLLNAQIKQMLRDRQLLLRTELVPTPYLIQIMQEVEKDVGANKNIIRTTSEKELIAYLNAL